MATRPVRTVSLIPYGRSSSSNATSLVGCSTISNVIAAGADVDDACAEHVGERDELGPAVGRRRHLHEQQLALDRVVAAELVDLEHVDQLVQLLDDLIDRGLRAVDADRDARAILALGGPDRQALDVEAAPREEPRDARQHAGLVLDEHGQRVVRAECALAGHQTPSSTQRLSSSTHSWSMMSSEPPPAGIIGYTFSSWSTRKSMTHGPPAVDGRHDRGVDVLLAVDPEAERAVGLGERLVVRHRREQVRLREALVVEQLLPLAHHAEPAVVDHADDHRDLVDDRGRELLQGHLEAAVAVDADHGRRRGGRAWRRARRGSRSPSCRARPR